MILPNFKLTEKERHWEVLACLTARIRDEFYGVLVSISSTYALGQLSVVKLCS